MSSPGVQPVPQIAPPPPIGLINTAPGGAAVPGAPPSGAQVTGYNPATATAANADAATYNPNNFTVNPNQTVASQLKDIIAAGSPLMQQAEANAKNQMNARGLINSTQAITAGQSAVIDKALPIAQQDATTFNQAATNTTTAQNTALAAGAQATNTANINNSQLDTNTSQYNAGQENAALSQATTASNAIQQAGQQIQGSKDIATLQSNTQKLIADLQANTTLSAQDKQTASAQIIAAANNQNAILLQQMQNDASLKNIQTQGDLNMAVQKLTDANKTLLQTSSGASQLYSQSLATMSNIITSNQLSQEQKTQALNNQVQQLNDALAVLSQVSGIPGLQSLLTFTNS